MEHKRTQKKLLFIPHPASTHQADIIISLKETQLLYHTPQNMDEHVNRRMQTQIDVYPKLEKRERVRIAAGRLDNAVSRTKTP